MANALIDPEKEHARREMQREYLEFLDDSLETRVYTDKVSSMIKENHTRLVVDMHDMWTRNAKRANGLLHNFVEEIVCFEAALKDFVAQVDVDYAKQNDELFIGFEGGLGERHVNPRTLKSRFLSNLVCCEGIVTKCSLVRPKVVRSVHYCPNTDKTVERRYTDLTSYTAVPRATDENKNPLETEFGLSTYKDHQTFSIQELPESAPAGQLPRSLDIVADHDLSDSCKPGDRVRVYGLFRCLPGKQQGYTNGTFRTIVIANNVQLMSKEVNSADLDGDDVRRIKSFSKQFKRNGFHVLARSLAPSIHGHDEVKRAILCQLLGGTEKLLENGTRLRGDINVMLIGDPSVAKSQLLRYVLHTAPRALATTGRGSSGVGLTAAVTTDAETGERRLEAGAMVLADRGIVCIDEFDKMSDIDRTAIHEAMEQGRVTIAKAGIHAKLNARCSVLAAANPVYGRYDVYKTPMENIGMQDSLLSRFDCLFVLLDEHDAERDTCIAEHVVKLHRYRAAGEADGHVLDMGSGIDVLSAATADATDEAVLTAINVAAQQDRRGGRGDDGIWETRQGWTAASVLKRNERVVTAEFLRKYITLAKSFKPTLGAEASTYICDKYAELRATDEQHSDRERTTPVTPRQLETMIRLSTAIAKARLSNAVSVDDAEEAYSLMHFACFKEKPRERVEAERRAAEARAAKRAGGQRHDSGSEGNDEHDMNEDDEENTTTIVTRTDRTRRRQRAEDTDENMDETEAGAADTIEEPTTKRARTEPITPAISVDRYAIFRRHVRTTFDRLATDPNEGVDRQTLVNAIQAGMAKNAQFTESELLAAWDGMGADNACMIDELDRVVMI